MFIEQYNLLNIGSSASTYFLGSMFLLVIGFISYVFRKRVVRKFFKILPYFSFLTAVIFMFLFFQKSFEYNKYKKIILNKEHKVVEGIISKLEPMEPGVKDYEEINIEGLTFRYSDFQSTLGFKNTTYMNGPLYEGAEVRIFYYENIILALWIKE